VFYIVPVLFFLGKYSQKVMKTLPTIAKKHTKKTQSTQERGNTRNEMELPTSPRRQMNHPPLGKGRPQGEHHVLEHPSVVREAYQLKKGEDLLKGHLA
jgi:hypothetical protein